MIVDDGSTDGTASIIEQWCRRDSRFRLIRQANAGVAAARNTGFAAASPGSQFITFMDSDDVYLPHALGTLVGSLASDPRMIGAHGLAEMIDQDSQPQAPGEFSSFQRARTGFDGHEIVPWGTVKPTSFETVIHHSRIYPPGLLMTRRPWVQRVGPFDAAVSPVEDWDMLIRLTRLGDIAFVNEVILHYRRHPAQATTASLDRIYRATDRLRVKTFRSPENTPEQLDTLRGSFRAYQRMKIREKRRSAFASVSKGRLVSAARDMAHIAGHAARILRGRPS
jgi:glycosyltransferase involved in cell wall biosynthesis